MLHKACIKRTNEKASTIIFSDQLPDPGFQSQRLHFLTDTIFYKNEVKESYKEFFDREIQKYSIEEINSQFDNKLSLNALLYLNVIQEKKV